MRGLLERWNVGRCWRAGRAVLTGMLLSNIPTVQLSAQVGHPPGDSPYRDIEVRSGPVLYAGYLSGDRGTVDVGPSNALSFGARYELPTGRSLLVQLGAAYLQGDRFVVNPTADSASAERRTGPVRHDLLHLDVTLQLRLTGAKTWNGLAPYAGAGLGMLFDVNAPADTISGYKFGSKISFSGGAGTRWYALRNITVHADARLVFWRLRYPSAFRTPAPDGSRVISLDDELTDWTIHPWLSLGVGWTF